MIKKVSLAFVLLLLIAIVCGADYLVRVAVLPEVEHMHNEAVTLRQVYDKYPELEVWRDSMIDNGLWRDTTIISHDGTKRHLIVMEHAMGDIVPGATLVVHGYCDNALRMMRYAYLHYTVLGRNVVLPDLYGHGRSDGDNVRFGWLDSKDCVYDYLPFIHSQWPGMNIVQHGLSMGAATTMMTAGESLPDSLKVIGFIEDCGYTSTWDELAYNLKRDYHLPAFPLLYVANWITNLKYGWDMCESSSINQLKKSQKPMFFIHGDDDDFVPTEMVYRCYDAKVKGEKEIWIVPAAKHARSIHEQWEDYCQKLRAWLSKLD